MAFLDQTFNVDELPVNESTGDFSPIPEGMYSVVIKDATVKPTKAAGGQYISLRLDITDGQYARRVLWSNINIKNASSEAERIGRAQLGDILRAIGVAQLSDTDQLIGGQMDVKVVIGSYNGEPKNEVKSYKASGNAVAVTTPVVQPQTTGKAAPPWAKK